MGDYADYLIEQGLLAQAEDPDNDDDWLDEVFDRRRKHNTMSEIGIVKLQGVRLSFPALFEAKSFNDGKPKFSAVFLLNKKTHAAAIKAIQAEILKVTKEKWPKGVKGLKPSCLHEGSEKEDVDGYGAEVMYLTSSNAKRVPVVGADMTPLTEADGKPYAGCYVNCSVRLWAQDNEWGKRINAQLRAVQFAKDGEPFGEKPADPEQEFSPVAEEGGDGDNDLL